MRDFVFKLGDRAGDTFTLAAPDAFACKGSGTSDDPSLGWAGLPPSEFFRMALSVEIAAVWWG
jgi:hypothetical protein